VSEHSLCFLTVHQNVNKSGYFIIVCLVFLAIFCAGKFTGQPNKKLERPSVANQITSLHQPEG